MNAGNESSHVDDAVEHLRADIDRARDQIDRTGSEIEGRLAPRRLREVAGERLREAARPWQDQPGEQLYALFRESATRVREMAWINPLGLGLASAVVGYLLGRRDWWG